MGAIIRKAKPSDVGRLAEIIVYNNRLNYYPIFQNMEYSFVEYNVIDVAKEFLEDEEFMDHCYVYEDCAIKGFICVIDHEIKKLYVDSFFQGNGIGAKLLQYSISELHVDNLWALEKNTKALKFYQSHGFYISDEKVYEEDTTEYLVHLFR